MQVTSRFVHRAMRMACLMLTSILIVGCSALPRLGAVPDRLAASAVIPGLEGVRYVVGDANDMQRLTRDVADTWPRERAWLAAQAKPSAKLPTSSLLALSGGGDNGAFGAGVLNGWTATGTRPEFLLVTGISTGALIAPFAFLGPKYDAVLRDLYTRNQRADILSIRKWWAILTEDAVADTTPLRMQLQKHIDQAFLDEIALEYDKGRELWISTTNLDAHQRVIWNMTKLAASKHPRSLALFHDVMLASAAIPGAFPPVMIDVELNGIPYQEMHVDGGIMAQVFVYPPNVKLADLSHSQDGERERQLYVLMNTRMDPNWAQTQRSVLSIAGRAISSMIHTQGVGDLYRIYLTAQRDQVQFNLTHIPEDFLHDHPEEFDNTFMQALYARGYQQAVSGQAWKKQPPGF
jgi:predicted patatin/cPLA2 family phospholipase